MRTSDIIYGMDGYHRVVASSERLADRGGDFGLVVASKKDNRKFVVVVFPRMNTVPFLSAVQFGHELTLGRRTTDGLNGFTTKKRRAYRY